MVTVTEREGRRIAVVIGSTRPGRICAGIAGRFADLAGEESSLRYELVDLAEVNLPFLDEPVPAALNQYQHEHTRAWSQLVRSFDGFVFVFPQYNWGYPAPLKNALDFLYWEWRDRPVSFVTYGNHGGSRAALQIQGVLEGLHMKELSDHLEVRITDEDVDDKGQILDVDAVLVPYRDQMRSINAQMTAALEDC
ncbi:MAG: NADPH-dependent FMN reductase [Acidimicrobiales bacterium]